MGADFYFFFVEALNILVFVSRFLLHLQVNFVHLTKKELGELAILNWGVYLFYVKFGLVALYFLVVCWTQTRTKAILNLYIRLHSTSIVLHVAFFVSVYMGDGLKISFQMDKASSFEFIFVISIIVLALMDFTLLFIHIKQSTNTRREHTRTANERMSFNNQYESDAYPINQSESRMSTMNQSGSRVPALNQSGSRVPTMNQSGSRMPAINQSEIRQPPFNQSEVMIARSSAPVLEQNSMEAIPLESIIGPPPPYKP